MTDDLISRAAALTAVNKVFNGYPNQPADAIRALATPDQTAALDRVRAEAKAEGMREAAEIAAEFVHRRLYEANMPACSYHSRDIKTAILAAIETLRVNGGENDCGSNL